MGKNADLEFEDARLRSRIEEAYNAVGPSKEAEERMLAKLLAYQEEFTSQADASMPEKHRTDGLPLEASAPSPRPKRILRPWQVLVPAAAVLVLVGIAVASGPLFDSLSSKEAAPMAEQAAADNHPEAAGEQDGFANSAESAPESALEASGQDSEEGMDAAMALSSTEDVASNGLLQDVASAEEAVSAERVQDAATAEGADGGDRFVSGSEHLSSANPTGHVPMVNPADYVRIQAEDGRVFALVQDAPEALPLKSVGALLAEGSAYTQEGAEGAEASVFQSLDPAFDYLVSFAGEELFYPVREI